MEILLGLIIIIGLLILLFVIKLLDMLKKSIFMIKTQFDKDFMDRFDLVYDHLTQNRKFVIGIDGKGKAKKYIKDDRY